MEKVSLKVKISPSIHFQLYLALRINDLHSRYPNNWRLMVSDVRRADGGLYVCEISSFPPKVLLTRLRVKGEGDEGHKRPQMAN